MRVQAGPKCRQSVGLSVAYLRKTNLGEQNPADEYIAQLDIGNEGGHQISGQQIVLEHFQCSPTV